MKSGIQTHANKLAERNGNCPITSQCLMLITLWEAVSPGFHGDTKSSAKLGWGDYGKSIQSNWGSFDLICLRKWSPLQDYLDYLSVCKSLAMDITKQALGEYLQNMGKVSLLASGAWRPKRLTARKGHGRWVLHWVALSYPECQQHPAEEQWIGSCWRTWFYSHQFITVTMGAEGTIRWFAGRLCHAVN